MYVFPKGHPAAVSIIRKVARRLYESSRPAVLRTDHDHQLERDSVKVNKSFQDKDTKTGGMLSNVYGTRRTNNVEIEPWH